jgi:spoIIIJ-associated protein
MMEWVETTARTVEEAKERALDQLGVVADEADFEILAEPKQGLFGRVRGEARVRARVRPAPVRPKQDRRRGRRSGADTNGESANGDAVATAPPADRGAQGDDAAAPEPDRARRRGGGGHSGRGAAAQTSDRPETSGGPVMSNDDTAEPDGSPAAEASPADVEAVREAALGFVGGLTDAFGLETAVEAAVEGSEIEVRVSGQSLGLLIGPGGRTLLAIQDLARVAAQRRLGDHDTRLRVDVAGYREKRRVALERFAASVAEQVKESGVARSLDPMPSADRKVLHDALGEIAGVSSRSEGEDPNRRVVVSPA